MTTKKDATTEAESTPADTLSAMAHHIRSGDGQDFVVVSGPNMSPAVYRLTAEKLIPVPFSGPGGSLP